MALMRIAILADIHGNILALEAVLTDLPSRKVDKLINLGDCVSGPLWPRETAELLMRLSWPTVRGNHDRWVTDWPPDKHYRSDAFAYQALESSQLAWLRALPATLEVGDEVFACHGRPDDDNAYLLENVEGGRLARARRAPAANYAVLQLSGDQASLEHIAIPYDHAAAARRAEENQSPAWAHFLATGFARNLANLA
jgi:predicted phosphodiesterase